MVEIEEINDDGNKKATTAATGTGQKKKRLLRKDFPPLTDMLANGSPESRGRPKTFCDIFGYPIFIAVCFALSLLAFHYAPHEKSVQPRGKFSMNNMKQGQRKVPVPPPAQDYQDHTNPTSIDDIVMPEQINKDGEL